MVGPRPGQALPQLRHWTCKRERLLCSYHFGASKLYKKSILMFPSPPVSCEGCGGNAHHRDFFYLTIHGRSVA